MQNVTKLRKKKAPILCAAVVIAALGIFLLTVLLPLIGEIWGETLAVCFLLLYVAGITAVIVGIVAALRQRLREIESGEEEDAKKY